MMGEQRLSAVDVTKEFASDPPVIALESTTFEIGDREFAALVGPSGCGKSTLLTIAAGLQEASAGSVLVDGEPVRGPGRDRGVVFQSYTLFPWLTAQQNVEFALRGERIGKQERQRRAAEHLELVGLEDFAEAYPAQLSGGMRQRVAIARSLSYRPKILLMDEPFGALDALTRQLMQELLTTVWEHHRLTVLFVTHDIGEAIFLSDRVLLMSARPGRIRQEVTIDLPRPRTRAIEDTPAFAAYKRELFDAIRDEAVKAASDERRGSR